MSRKLTNGKLRYTAQFHLKRDSKVVFSASKSFAKKHDDQNCARNRESEIATKGLPNNKHGMTVAAECECWQSDMERTHQDL